MMSMTSNHIVNFRFGLIRKNFLYRMLFRDIYQVFAVTLSLGLGLGLKTKFLGLGLGLGLAVSGLGLGLGLELCGLVNNAARPAKRY